MVVDGQRGKGRILDHAPEHHGQALGRDDLGLGAGFAQVGAGELGAAAHVRVASGSMLTEGMPTRAASLSANSSRRLAMVWRRAVLLVDVLAFFTAE
jgi:hypothetical protein